MSSSSALRDCKMYIFDGAYVSTFNERPGARDATGMPSIWYTQYLELVDTVPFVMPTMKPASRTEEEAATCVGSTLNGLTLVPKHSYAAPQVIMKPKKRYLPTTISKLSKMFGEVDYLPNGIRGGAGYRIGFFVVDRAGTQRNVEVAIIWAHNATVVDFNDVYFYTRFITSPNIMELKLFLDSAKIVTPGGGLSLRGYDYETAQESHPCVIALDVHDSIFKHYGIDPAAVSAGTASLPPMSRELYNLVKSIVNGRGSQLYSNPFEKFYGNNFRARLDE